MAREAAKKRQTTEAHDEKRNEILGHCATLFDRVGYHKASMQMLAALLFVLPVRKFGGRASDTRVLLNPSFFMFLRSSVVT